MKVTLVLEGTTFNATEHIGRMASICYDSDKSAEACIKRASKCKDSGHLATMRFAMATFNVAEISRITSHQIVRMAHAGILQRSQRYVKETKVEFVDPPALTSCSPNNKEAWKNIQQAASNLYIHLVDSKQMKKEDARYILPQGCFTEMNLCLNFQGWQDFLRNRNAKHAQWEVRGVAAEINRQLNELAPELFPITKEVS